MAQFLPALNFVLDNEDSTRSYAINTDNNGGKVIAGINSKSWPDAVASIEVMPQSDRAAAVSNFYQAAYWNPLKLGGIAFQEIADRTIDQHVNGNNGGRLLQRAINLIAPGALIEDGVIGPMTIEVANAQDPERLLAALRTVRVNFYEKLIDEHPEFEPFRNGWLARARK